MKNLTMEAECELVQTILQKWKSLQFAQSTLLC